MNNDVSYEYVLSCDVRYVVGCIPLVITNQFIIPSGGDIIGHFVVCMKLYTI